MRSEFAVVLSHVLAVFAVVATPYLARRRYRALLRRIEAGEARAKSRLYPSLLWKQAAVAVAVLALWIPGGVPPDALGIRAPYSWVVTAALAVSIVGFFAWSSLRLRPKAARLREKLRERGGTILPATPRERRWFAAVSGVGAVSEELLYRGFLFDYLAHYLPAVTGWEAALLTSAIFGLAHLYQGKKGVLATGIAGLFLAALYLASGSLLLPIVVHAAGNLRALLIFRNRE